MQIPQKFHNRIEELEFSDYSVNTGLQKSNFMSWAIGCKYESPMGFYGQCLFTFLKITHSHCAPMDKNNKFGTNLAWFSGPFYLVAIYWQHSVVSHHDQTKEVLRWSH